MQLIFFFDAVFSNAPIHWVKNHRAVVQSVRNVLKPKGKFVAKFGVMEMWT